MNERDIKFMRHAMELAERAAAQGEVPVGAVVVQGETVVGYGHNTRETGKNALHHAEIAAIDMACKRLGGWRLPGCELFVTLEPCPMCAGACINSRIERVVFGARDAKFGAVGSVVNLFEEHFNWKPEAVPDILREESETLLKNFFRDLRKKKKET